jgi:hypothetical protein
MLKQQKIVHYDETQTVSCSACKGKGGQYLMVFHRENTGEAWGLVSSKDDLYWEQCSLCNGIGVVSKALNAAFLLLSDQIPRGGPSRQPRLAQIRKAFLSAENS